MFKCFMNSNKSMNAAACASVSAFACSCQANNSADNAILRLLDAVLAVSIFVLAELMNIILNKIIIVLLAKFDYYRPSVARA